MQRCVEVVGSDVTGQSAVGGSNLTRPLPADPSGRSKPRDLIYSLGQPNNAITMNMMNELRRSLTDQEKSGWSDLTSLAQLETQVVKYRIVEQLLHDSCACLKRCDYFQSDLEGALISSFMFEQLAAPQKYIELILLMRPAAFECHIKTLLLRIEGIVNKLNAVSEIEQKEAKDSFQSMVQRGEMAIVEQMKIMLEQSKGAGILTYCEEAFGLLQKLTRYIKPFFEKPLSIKVIKQLGLYQFFNQIVVGVMQRSFQPFSHSLSLSFVEAVRELLDAKKEFVRDEHLFSLFCCMGPIEGQVSESQMHYINDLLSNIESQSGDSLSY